MSQLHGINGAQQPQATGISPSVGKLGLHSVQLGTNPPVRLDAIKGNKIPFAGFRTATKVVNAKTGVRVKTPPLPSVRWPLRTASWTRRPSSTRPSPCRPTSTGWARWEKYAARWTTP
ncbi:MAG: hypothetical protein ACLS73_05065 [Bilophila wadsworthia]